jgi:hypothetical protein
LRRPREEVSRFLVEALRVHHLILPKVHGPDPIAGGYCSDFRPIGPVIYRFSYINFREWGVSIVPF